MGSMEEKKIDLELGVFAKREYTKVIDNSFKELGVTSIKEEIIATSTVEDFFKLYNELFYDIPSEGGVNSHRYLIEQSGGYINFEAENEESLALRQEITQLRQELLETQMANITQVVGEDSQIENSPEYSNLIAQVKDINKNINNISI